MFLVVFVLFVGGIGFHKCGGSSFGFVDDEVNIVQERTLNRGSGQTSECMVFDVWGGDEKNM